MTKGCANPTIIDRLDSILIVDHIVCFKKKIILIVSIIFLKTNFR